MSARLTKYWKGACAFFWAIVISLAADAQIYSPIVNGGSFNAGSPPAIGGTTPAAGTFNPLTVGAVGSQAILQGDVANALGQRNGTNAQIFRVYNTFTDLSNYERLDIGPNAAGIGANIFGVMATNAGTGTNRSLAIGMGANSRIVFTSSNTIQLNTLTTTTVATIQSTGLTLTTGGNANQLRTTQTTVPTVTVNGGTSPVCVGSDSAMRCTIGTAPPAAATFTVTFFGTWGAAPSCMAMRGTTGATPLVQGVVTGTTTVVVNLSANLVASEIFHIHCIGVA